jgi:hypothetical protein
MPWRRMGRGCIDPRILGLGNSWRWVVSFTPRPLYPRGKNPRYPVKRKLGVPQSRSERCREEENLALAGNWTRAVQPLTSLYTDCPIPAPQYVGDILWHHLVQYCTSILIRWTYDELKLLVDHAVHTSINRTLTDCLGNKTNLECKKSSQ